MCKHGTPVTVTCELCVRDEVNIAFGECISSILADRPQPGEEHS